ncbi:hypothetical protein O9929_02590 [Vibrio lentus]|nr:hypothetical protein [Vibrio lentus]
MPTNTDVLGPIAKILFPIFNKCLSRPLAGWRERDIERRLYIARRRIEKQITEDKDFYICSLSTQVMVYKGLCMLKLIFRDFTLIFGRLTYGISNMSVPPAFLNPMISRGYYSAQPFRYLAHNGEINTIEGNLRQWAKARAYKFSSPLLPDLQANGRTFCE